MPARTSPFDPGYDPVTFESHLEQSSHLISILKLSMACWIIASEAATRRKIAVAGAHGIPTVAGGGPFEIAVAQRRLPDYLDLCADMGFTRIECGQGFTDVSLDVHGVVGLARDRGLDVQFELGSKHGGAFTADAIERLVEQGRRWLDAGARELVIEARESAQAVGLFDAKDDMCRDLLRLKHR
jgi:phosphosulfolactate synthase